MARGKRYQECIEKIDRTRQYPLEEAVTLFQEMPKTKFDETVELAIRLGVDPRHADQQVRGTVVLPHGIGKNVKVLVLTKGEKEREARDAGADYVGSDDYIQKIQEGWLDFDIIIATPDVMGNVAKLGRILGRRGLMPNPKSGTVTQDVTKAIRDAKAGRIEFRVDKAGNIHAPIGKMSFPKDKICENAKTFLEAIARAKPQAAKGTYFKSITISSTMSPGIKIDRQAVLGHV